MEIHVAALVNLIVIAQSDGEVTPDERALIDRYRRALRVSTTKLDRALEHCAKAPLSAATIHGSKDERISILTMMIKVACADGRLTDRERCRLEQVAICLSIQPVQYAELLVGMEQRLLQRQRIQRLIAWLAGLTGAAMLVLFSLQLLNIPNSEPNRTDVVALTEEEAFKEIDRRYRESVLLIVIWFDLIRGQERIGQSGTGTGFFVSATGHIVTSKHLVEPWKFRPSVIQLIEGEGYRLDRDSIRIAAWPGDSRLRDESGKLELGQAFSMGFNRETTLKTHQVGPDQFENRDEHLPDGTSFTGKFHVRSNADLAILKAMVDRPVVPVRLTDNIQKPESLDRVLIIGYPAGLSILESSRATPSSCPGSIRKVEDTIYMTTPVVKGNSGGPTFDIRGRAIGVVTRYVSENTLSTCIRIHHILDLLPEGETLFLDALRLEQEGYPGAALNQYGLAKQRWLAKEGGLAKSGDPRESIRLEAAAATARLLEERDRLVRKAETSQREGRAEEAKRTLEIAIQRFGRHWILEPKSSIPGLSQP